jgi:hypothetical protein
MKVPKQHNPGPMQVPLTAQPQTSIPPAYLAMAAAHMDSLGKLNLQGPPQLPGAPVAPTTP